MLVGRDRQVRHITAHVATLSEGRGGLLLIAGEAGIGKTRLAEEAIRLAHDAGFDAQRVTCWAEEGAPPFWPWSQLLRALGSDAIDTTAGDADRELARFQLFTAVADALHDLATTRARLLVVDDLHWADAPSVHLLAFLAQLKAGEPEVRAPRYSHLTYDVLDGEEIILRSPDIVIVEGVNVLQTPTRRGRGAAVRACQGPRRQHRHGGHAGGPRDDRGRGTRRPCRLCR